MKMWSHSRYLIVSGIAIAVILLLMVAVNFIVDPYNRLGNNKTAVYFWNERQTKDAILSYDHQAVLMGSSKTGYVNPDDLTCYRFYNASIRGAVPEEMFFYLKKYLRHEKLVLIGFDFYMFNERELPLVRIKDWDDFRYSTAEYLVGGHTVSASYKTLKKWKKKDPVYGIGANGQFAFPGSTEVSSADPRQCDKKYYDIIKGLARHHYAHFSFSRRRMDYVREIKSLLEAKGIPYAVFINPLNQDVFSSLQQLEAYGLFLSWKQEMKTIFPNIYDYSSGRYSARQWYYREDPYHYTNDAGKSFLNEMIKDFCAGSPSQP